MPFQSYASRELANSKGFRQLKPTKEKQHLVIKTSAVSVNRNDGGFTHSIKQSQRVSLPNEQKWYKCEITTCNSKDSSLKAMNSIRNQIKYI